MTILRTAFLTAICMAMLAPAGGWALPAGPPGQVIVAKNSQDPLLIWQASRELYTLMGDGASDAEINTRLAHDALKVVASNLSKVRSKTGILSVNVMYNRMAANGLNYAVFSLANASTYATLQLQLHDARRNRDKWMSLADHANIPAWIHFKVTGKLPGR